MGTVERIDGWVYAPLVPRPTDPTQWTRRSVIVEVASERQLHCKICITSTIQRLLCSLKVKSIYITHVNGELKFFAWLLVQAKVVTVDKLDVRNWPGNPTFACGATKNQRMPCICAYCFGSPRKYGWTSSETGKDNAYPQKIWMFARVVGEVATRSRCNETENNISNPHVLDLEHL